MYAYKYLSFTQITINPIVHSGDYEVTPAPDSDFVLVQMIEEEQFAGDRTASSNLAGTKHFNPSPDFRNAKKLCECSNSGLEIGQIEKYKVSVNLSLHM